MIHGEQKEINVGTGILVGSKRHTVVHGALAPSFYLALLDQSQWQLSILRKEINVSLILLPAKEVFQYRHEPGSRQAPIIAS